MLSVRFPLLLLVLFPLSLIFVPLITMGLGVFLLRFILHGAFSASWTWVTISFPTLGKFSAISSSNIFSGPFFLLLGPYNVNVGAFNVAPEVS